MALRLEEILATERERLVPYTEILKSIIRSFDPAATFSPLQPGHVPEFWELDARVRPDLAEDDALHDAVAREETRLLVEHDAAIVVLLLPQPGPTADNPHRTKGKYFTRGTS